MSTAEQLAALGPHWKALHARAPGASVFNSWEWQSAWWKWYGAGRPLRVFVVKDEEGVAGILPCYIDKVRVLKLFSLSMLRNLGTGGDTSPDDLDVLADPRCEQGVVEALAGLLARDRGEWDILLLSDMAKESAFRAALVRSMGKASHREGISARISIAKLPANWDDYLGSLHRDRRYTIRKTRRRILEQDGAKLFVWNDPGHLDDAIDRLIDLHHQRWNELGESHSFSTPQYRGFHREVMHACQDNDWLRLYCLQIGDQIVAMYYCYRFRGRVYYFQGGFDPAISRLRPGLVLMGYAIQSAIEEGNEVFDMLRGEYDYKTQWAKDRRTTWYFIAYGRGIGVLAYRARREWLPALKQYFRAARIQKEPGHGNDA